MRTPLVIATIALALVGDVSTEGFDADRTLAEHVVSCWTNFAKTGRPGLGWKPYTPDAPGFMIFDLDETGFS
ncbi:MAG: carboxylesterase family protein [Bacteroidales bacterium]|nr:carboxylesterase family protein [Bacteroidales bacterium]